MPLHYICADDKLGMNCFGKLAAYPYKWRRCIPFMMPIDSSTSHIIQTSVQSVSHCPYQSLPWSNHYEN